MIAAALASSPPALPGFLNALSSPLQHYGVWAIGLLIMLEDFGIPVPGETILIAGAVYAGAGRLNVLAVGRRRLYRGHYRRQHRLRHRTLRWPRPGPAVGQVRVPDRRATQQGRGLLRPPRRYRHHVRALRRGPAPGERDHRRHHRHALAAFSHLQCHRRRVVGRDLGQPRLPRRKPHRHDLPLHNAVLVLRAHRAGGADRGLYRLAPPAAPPTARSGRGQAGQ